MNPRYPYAKTLLAMFTGVLVLCFTTPSHAVSIDETMTKNEADLGPSDTTPLQDQTISFTGLNPNPTGDATITFSVRGDFNGANENVLLSVDGFSFGTWLNDITGDDDIDLPADDVGG